MYETYAMHAIINSKLAERRSKVCYQIYAFNKVLQKKANLADMGRYAFLFFKASLIPVNANLNKINQYEYHK